MYPTLGSDPELVAVAESDSILRQYGLEDRLLGLPIPAYYAMGVQNVDHPDIVLPHGTLTPDGMAVEFTLTPTSDVETMVTNLRGNLQATRNLLAARGVKLTVEPHFPADMAYIDRLPPEFGKKCSLQILGCAPDFCVYDSVEIPDRPDPKQYPFRTSGGHIHVQVGEKIISDNALLTYTIAAMDSVLGTASGFLCTSPQALQRMALYGSAGMCRVNTDLWTFEYRTLPAQALVQTEQVARLMFTAASAVCGHIMDVVEAEGQSATVKYLMSIFGSYSEVLDRLVPAINQHNMDECRELNARVGDRLSGYATIASTIQALQSYVLPESFDLDWEWK